MGDVPYPIEPPAPEPTTAERVNESARVAAVATARAITIAIAGEGSPIRRPLLFIVTGVALALNLPALGFAALLALALTDAVVAL